MLASGLACRRPQLCQASIMTLTNRVTPFGDLIAHPSRGLFMGNRGGRLHDGGTKTLPSRRWGSKRWICCLLSFKGRRRQIWGRGYTELFFLDEVTALAAGHRPCAECRRRDARRFQAAVGTGLGLASPPSLDQIDAWLHEERRDRRAKRLHPGTAEDLPSGAMIVRAGAPFALREQDAMRWNHEGYGDPEERSTGAVEVVTPPLILAALRGGYEPLWHPTAR
jgi:hypothetical protein